jgi:glycosyltransferase involved in cell wall biosynthesis
MSKSKEKILIITYFYLPYLGGIEHNIYQITSFLAKRYDVTILTLERNNQKDTESDGTVLIKRQKMLRFLSFNYSKFDYIIVENFNIFPHFLLFISILFRRIFGKHSKLILVPHGGFFVNKKNFSYYQYLIKKIYHRFFGVFFVNNFIYKVVAVSEWEKNELLKLNINAPITVIGNGIENFNLENTKKEKYFIFIGRIAPIKNLEGIIDVFAQLHQHPFYDDYKLKIVGAFDENNPYFLMLQNKIHDLNLENYILFCGEKKFEEKNVFLRHASALICISHTENDPIVIKEALSQKTKVLTHARDGLAAYMGNENVFFTENGIDPLKLHHFLHSKFSVTLHNLYTWEDISKQYASIL